jgi:hypothetical protein
VLGVDAVRRGARDEAVTELGRSLDVSAEVLPGVAWRASAVLGSTTGDARATAQARSIHERLAMTLEEPARARFQLAFSSELASVQTD